MILQATAGARHLPTPERSQPVAAAAISVVSTLHRLPTVNDRHLVSDVFYRRSDQRFRLNSATGIHCGMAAIVLRCTTAAFCIRDCKLRCVGVTGCRGPMNDWSSANGWRGFGIDHRWLDLWSEMPARFREEPSQADASTALAVQMSQPVFCLTRQAKIP